MNSKLRVEDLAAGRGQTWRGREQRAARAAATNSRGANPPQRYLSRARRS